MLFPNSASEEGGWTGCDVEGGGTGDMECFGFQPSGDGEAERVPIVLISEMLD